MAKKHKKNQSMQNIARKLVTSVNPKSVVSEQFRTMRTNINFTMPDEELRTILFTSASPGDGKSTIVANTAVVFAEEGKRVLLVDADMRRPSVHYTFHLTNTIGLSNLLTSQKTLIEATSPSEIDGLDIITCGPIPPNPAELLGSRRMDIVLVEMKEKYDIILFDAPPVLSVTDAQILSNKCDGTILVMNTGETKKKEIIRTKEVLISSQATIIGGVLNNFVLDKDQNYYQYYGTGE